MPLIPYIPAQPVLPYNLKDAPDVTFADNSSRYSGGAVPSPVGQPRFGVRAGYAQSDRSGWALGADVTIPLTVGVTLFGVRGDFDYWQDFGSGKTRGGTAWSLLGVFGPGTGYFGVGPAYAARYGGSSGPSGAGVKGVFGASMFQLVGYELSAIVGSKGSMAAAMLTFHF